MHVVKVPRELQISCLILDWHDQAYLRMNVRFTVCNFLSSFWCGYTKNDIRTYSSINAGTGFSILSVKSEVFQSLCVLVIKLVNQPTRQTVTPTLDPPARHSVSASIHFCNVGPYTYLNVLFFMAGVPCSFTCYYK